MLRQSKTENKAAKPEDFHFQASDGRIIVITRAEAEAFSQCGPWSPEKIQAMAHYDIILPNGRPARSFLPIPPSRDPLEPTREEASPEILEGIALAEAALQEYRTRMRAAVDAIHGAQALQQRAARREDRRAYNEAVAKEREVRQRYQTLCEGEAPLRKHLSDAEAALKRWLDDERLYRSGHPRPEAVVF